MAEILTATKEGAMGKIVLVNQSELCVSNVTKFISSTDVEVCILMDNKAVIINGKELHITKLDVEKGDMILEGLITSIKYESKIENKFSLKKIFNR